MREVSGGWRFGPNTPARMSTILRGRSAAGYSRMRAAASRNSTSLVDPSLHEFLAWADTVER